jgi:hypothetical protein
MLAESCRSVAKQDGHRAEVANTMLRPLRHGHGSSVAAAAAAYWPWPCRGCGGPVTKRAIGRTPRHCSDECRSAAWRDQARGRNGPDLARRKAARRAARAQEPPRLTPGEQGIIRCAWLAGLVGYCAGDPDREELLDGLGEEAAAGAWPEPIARAAAAGLWPGDEGAEGVIEGVISGRLKLAKLSALRGGTQSTGRRGGL